MTSDHKPSYRLNTQHKWDLQKSMQGKNNVVLERKVHSTSPSCGLVLDMVCKFVSSSLRVMLTCLNNIWTLLQVGALPLDETTTWTKKT